jgi:hypothetical protein
LQQKISNGKLQCDPRQIHHPVSSLLPKVSAPLNAIQQTVHQPVFAERSNMEVSVKLFIRFFANQIYFNNQNYSLEHQQHECHQFGAKRFRR